MNRHTFIEGELADLSGVLLEDLAGGSLDTVSREVAGRAVEVPAGRGAEFQSSV